MLILNSEFQQCCVIMSTLSLGDKQQSRATIYGLIFINIIYSFRYLANIYKNSVVIALVTSREFHSGSELQFMGVKVTVYTVIIQSVKTNCKTESKVSVLKRDI